ncbi:MAG: fibronectin type III domain-containing protein [Candidatus Nanopelagicaceae bacterium]|nr:fibronectin type III domain-containing protein [Candidatus Nanopelagicaceae bacterium]
MRNREGLMKVPSGRGNRSLLILLVSALSALMIAPSAAASLPGAPQYVEAMAGSTQVAVTWDAPSSTGGEATLTYTARVWTVPPPTASPVFASCSTTALGCVISGLTTGSAYYVDVVASNSAGTGAPSAMKPISPGNAGSPPSNVSATSDDKGMLSVKWSPSSSLGTGQFAWYAAEVFTGPDISAGSYAGYCTESSALGNTCLIGGLKIGTTYYVQVRTVSSLGSSYPTSPRYKVVAGAVASATPTVPATSNSRLTAPQVVKVVALSKSVRVSWKAPVSTGGKKILGYRAGAYGPALTLLSYCKTTVRVFTCTIMKLKPKISTHIGVVALYSGAESPLSKLIAVIPKS